MILIGFCGYAGSGKSTAAQRLCGRHGFVRHRFAGPLKDMLRALGLSEEQVDGNLKEVPCALLGGKTPRWAAQSLGTEWGREMISPTLWVDAWAAKVDVSPVPVVCDDVRFPNEVYAVKQRGGIVVRITGRGAKIATSAHASENVNFEVDEEIENTGSIHDLHAAVDALVARLKKAA